MKDKPFKLFNIRRECAICNKLDYHKNLLFCVSRELNNEYFHKSCVLEVISDPKKWKKQPTKLEMCIRLAQQIKRAERYTQHLIDMAHKLHEEWDN